MSLTLVTPAASYPVSLAEAKAHCRVETTDGDGLLNGLIAAATDHVEMYTGRALIAQTWKLSLDAFADSMVLPKGPVQSVTFVKYLDTAEAEQTVPAADYTVDIASDPQRVARDSDASWPSAHDGVNVVNITFVSGYSAVPPAIKQALLLLVGQWYDQRSGVSDKPISETPHAVAALLSNYRSFAF